MQEETIRIGNEIFTYEIMEGGVVRIIGYENANGAITFDDDEYTIRIPAQIGDYPVVQVGKLKVSLKKGFGRGCFRQSYSLLTVLLPEHTSFDGFGKVTASMGGWCYPDFEVETYPRPGMPVGLTQTLGAYTFLARKVDDRSCEIFSIAEAETLDPNPSKNETIFFPGIVGRTEDEEALEEKLEMLAIPDEIGGYIPIRICSEATETLPADPLVIFCPETLREIGDDCFRNGESLRAVILGGVRKIGKNSFSYYLEGERGDPDYPSFTVYYDVKPVCEEGAFDRVTSVDEYEEYLDWGDMYTGSYDVRQEVEWREERLTQEDAGRLLQKLREED